MFDIETNLINRWGEFFIKFIKQQHGKKSSQIQLNNFMDISKYILDINNCLSHDLLLYIKLNNRTSFKNISHYINELDEVYTKYIESDLNEDKYTIFYDLINKMFSSLSQYMASSTILTINYQNKTNSQFETIKSQLSDIQSEKEKLVNLRTASEKDLESIKLQTKDLLAYSTTSSLSKAYQDLKVSTKKEVNKYDSLFKITIFIIFMLAALTLLKFNDTEHMELINIDRYTIISIFIIFITITIALVDRWLKAKEDKNSNNEEYKPLLSTLFDKHSDIINLFLLIFLMFTVLTVLNIGGIKGLQFRELTDFNQLMLAFASKLPVLIPISWLAIFAAKRRSEYDRLEQEYAHKEAIAKSYMAFQQQVQQLGIVENQKDLLHKLLNETLNAVSYNASETLEKSKHKEDVLPVELLKELKELVVKLAPKSDK